MKKVGPHQVIGEIGKGGMATVYRALQPSVNRVVALKVLPSHLETDEAMVRRFKQEAETAANLIHENIIKVWDASVNKPPYYIAMEFLEGGSLAERLVNGPLPVEEAVAITGGLCDALDYAHDRGVIHRDLKPENILFSANNKPILTDFGIARAIEYTSMTVAGAKFGTPDYMSPEQAKGLKVDYRTDLYSLAVVLYEMLTGQTPFRNEEPLVTMRQIIDEPVPSLRALNPNIPAEIEAVIIRALTKKPEERYQTGMEFNQALLNALHSSEVAATGLVEPNLNSDKKSNSKGAIKRLFSKSEGRPNRRNSVLLGLLLTTLVVGGLVTYRIFNYHNHTETAKVLPPTLTPGVYLISGQVTDDSGQGIKDVIVTFTGKSETTSTITDDSGNWSKNEAREALTVTVAKEGWSFVPASWEVSEANQGLNFTAKPLTYQVSGIVTNSSGKGIADVVITSSTGDKAVNTDINGAWSMGELVGTIIISAKKAGWSFSPVSHEVTGQSSDINFTGQRTLKPTKSATMVEIFSQETDGEVGNLNCNEWIACKNAGSGNYVTNKYLNGAVSASCESSQYSIERVFLYFDTSSIPANAQIKSAKLSVYASRVNGKTHIHLAPSTSGVSLSSYEFGSVSFESGGSATAFRNSWMSINLNPSALNWISKGGYTKLALIHDYDLISTIPKEINEVSIALTENAQYCPYLTITYSLP